MQLLEDSEATCRRFAADCIISMAPNGERSHTHNSYTVVSFRGKMQNYCCCNNVPPSLTDSLRNELVMAGAVRGVVGGLQFADSAVQASTAEALGILACDSGARQQVTIGKI